MLELVKPEYKKMIRDKANEAENFFKHADRDHEASLNFNPEMTELNIIDACAQYGKLTGEEPPLFLTYRIWFTANHSDLFIFPEELGEPLRTNARSIVQMKREEFFRTIHPLVVHIAGQGRRGQ